MKNFAYDIQLGFLAFPLVALLLALPYALYQYRRFGAISLWKTFVVFTFILYCLCAVSLIVFPLPSDHSTIVEIAQTPQLHPFNVIEQIRETTDFSLADRSTWGPTLRSKVVYEALFNVLLTIPLGAYLCYLFRCRWWMALLIGFATTLCFETSQLTGLFGIYEHPYRLFDVDDMVLNTAGCMLGFWMMIPLTWALPSMKDVNEHAIEKGTSRVSLTRRLVAGLVDIIACVLIFVVAWMVMSPTDAQIAKALAIDPSAAGAKTLAFRFIGGLVADPMSAVMVAFVIGIVMFAIVPMITKGRTLGNALVGLRIVKSDGTDAPAIGYLIRFLAIAFFCLIPLVAVTLAPEEIEGVRDSTLLQMAGLVVLVWLLTVIGRVIGSFSGHPYVSLSEAVSGTRLVPASAGADAAGSTRKRNTLDRQTHKGNVGTQSDNASDQDNNYQLESPYPSQPNGHASTYNGEDTPCETSLVDPTVAQPKEDDALITRTRKLQRDSKGRVSEQNQSQAGKNKVEPEEDDHGKQAALDSLYAVNYDEQHPAPGSGSTNAPTQIFAHGPSSSTSETRMLPGDNNSPTRVLDQD